MLIITFQILLYTLNCYLTTRIPSLVFIKKVYLKVRAQSTIPKVYTVVKLQPASISFIFTNKYSLLSL